MAGKTDILLLGATGYTGQLIAQYLAAHPERPTFSLALGGRSLEKLKKVAKDCALIPGDDVSLVEVDVLNEGRMREVVENYHVVIAAVGPFWKWGKSTAMACAEAGVNYVDITGESWFIRWCVDNCDYLASKNGAVLINSGGFDSVPSDVVAFLSNQTLKKAAGPNVSCGESVSAMEFPGDLKNNMSGGTISTTLDFITGRVPGSMRAHSGEYGLSPAIGKPVQGPLPTLISKVPYTNIIGSVFLMAPGNQRLVNRTWGLYKNQAATNPSDESTVSAYGDEFTYREFMARKNWLHAFVTNALLVFAGIVLYFGPLRAIAMNWLPKSGEGPSESALKMGWFKMTNVTKSAPKTSDEPKIAVKTTMHGRGEAGYYLTSVFIGEIALLLLPQNSHLLTPIGKQGGTLTAMSALGQPFIDRLSATGKLAFESEVLDTSR